MPKTLDHDRLRELIATGKTNAAIARQLGIATDTVRKHRRRLENEGQAVAVDEIDDDDGGRDDFGLRQQRAERRKAEERARQLEAEAKIARAERELEEVRRRDQKPERTTDWEAVARHLAPVIQQPRQQHPDESQRLLFDLVREQLAEQGRRIEQTQQHFRELLEAVRERPEPAPAPSSGKDPIDTATKQIEQMAALLDLADRFREGRQQGGEDSGSILERMVQRWIENRGLAAPPAGPRPIEPQKNGTPAPTPPPNSSTPPPEADDPMAEIEEQKRSRVQLFVRAIAQECFVGSDPETVADSEHGHDLVGMLPAAVRAPLLAGDWPRAWSACEQIDPAGCARLAPHLQADGVKQWLESYAKALSDSGDDGGDSIDDQAPAG